MKTYPYILRAAAGMPWAMEPRKLRQVASFLMLKAQGLDVPEDVKADVMALRAAARQPRTGNGVAVVPVIGSISYRANMLEEFSGGTSMQMLQRAFRDAVNDPNVGTVVLDIDSPGGSVDGVPEFADEIMAARADKKIIAVADTMAASAAYWIMSAASEAVVTPSGAVGSVGVYMLHVDESKALEAEGVDPTFISAGKFKTEGNPFEPLSDEARENFQSDVDAYYTMFVKAVAKGRGVSVSDVRNGFGQGRLVLAKDAKAQGMVDRIDTLSNVLSRLGVGSESGNRTRAEHYDAIMQAGFMTEKEAREAEGEGETDGRGDSAGQPAPGEFGRTEDGRVYVLSEWPKCLRLIPDAFIGSENIVVDGDDIHIVCENGEAHYRKMRDATEYQDRVWEAELIDADYSPVDWPIAGEGEPEAEATARNPRHRRLALLKA